MNQSISQNMSRNTNQGMMYQRSSSVSRAQNGCCAQNDSWSIPADETMIPNNCRADLMRFIDEVSFAAYDIMLYLDTHPDCQEALQSFRKYNELRNKALKLHAKSYGPLMLSSVDETDCSAWEWMMQPWPWELEGGAC